MANTLARRVDAEARNEFTGLTNRGLDERLKEVQPKYLADMATLIAKREAELEGVKPAPWGRAGYFLPTEIRSDLRAVLKRQYTRRKDGHYDKETHDFMWSVAAVLFIGDYNKIDENQMISKMECEINECNNKKFE